MVRVIVLGANGQLGKEFQNLSEKDSTIEWYFFDRKEIDITDSDSVIHLRKFPCDFIINCAAYTAVDKAEDEIRSAFEANAAGAGNLAAFCKDQGIVLIHISTDYVYGTSDRPHKEDGHIHPVNVYGKSKWEGEERIRNTLNTHFIFRTSWLYSSYGRNFVKTMLRLSKEKESLKVVNDQEGSPTYARSLARGVLHVIHVSSSGEEENIYGTYNFSNQGSTTWYEFAKAIIHFTNPEFPVFPVTSEEFVTRALRPKYSVLDCSKFEKTFSYSIPDWKEALRECLEILSE